MTAVDDLLRDLRAQATPERRRALVLKYQERMDRADEALSLIGIPDEELEEHCLAVLAARPELEGAWISIITGDAQYVRAAVGAAHVVELEGQTMPLASSICAEVVSNLEPIVEPDVASNPVLSACAVSEDFAGYAGVPLHFEGATVGTLASSAPKGVLSADVLPVMLTEADRIEAKMEQRWQQ